MVGGTVLFWLLYRLWAQGLFSKIHKTGLPTPFEITVRIVTYMMCVHIFQLEFSYLRTFERAFATEHIRPTAKRATMIGKQTKRHAHMS